MRDDVNPNKVIIALKRCVEATFDDGRWRELGFLTDSITVIERHPRLLRSLAWGDDDYGPNILGILPQILGTDNKNLRAVEEFVGLENWLREKDPALYSELYGVTTVSLERIDKAGKTYDVLELNRQISRIRHSIQADPALAVGSAKELLESLMKMILAEKSDELAALDVPQLLKRVRLQLGLDSPATGLDPALGQAITKTLACLGQVVSGIDQMRNLVGTGHGRLSAGGLGDAEARFAVNAAASVADYLFETWEKSRKASAA